MPNKNCLEGFKCPKCGHEDDFYIQTQMLMRYYDDGTDTPDHQEDSGNSEYADGDESYCRCGNSDCKFGGIVADFHKPKKRRS